LSCQMGLSDGAFFMIKHTPLPNGNHPISSPICRMGVADTLGHDFKNSFQSGFLGIPSKTRAKLESAYSLMVHYCKKTV
jgi:hypothetical protein